MRARAHRRPRWRKRDSYRRDSAGERADRAARRAARPGRHPQLAQEPDVAGGRRATRRAAAGRCGAKRFAAGAGYVLARQFNDPDGWELQNMLTVASLMVERRPGARGIARRPPADRLSRTRRCALAAASDARACVAAACQWSANRMRCRAVARRNTRFSAKNHGRFAEPGPSRRRKRV